MSVLTASWHSPVTNAIEHEIPNDTQAQEYIAAIQAKGIRVGIWQQSPVVGTAYAVVGPADIQLLHRALEALDESKRFSENYAAELSERLFREEQRRDG